MCYYVVCICVGLQWTFLYGYFSSKMSNLMLAIGDEVYNSNWFTHSDCKYHHLIILRSQIPVDFTGLKLIKCDLESFAKVCSSSN